MFQHCYRCGARHQVRGAPAAWCARCGGVLAAPTDRAPRVRWVAVPPPTNRPPRPVRRPPGPTPRYPVIPRWGLRDAAPGSRSTGTEAPTSAERVAALARTLQILLLATAILATLAAIAEAWRYVLAVRGRTELLGARTVAISDSAVFAGGLLAPVLATAAAVVAIRWLIRAREAAAARQGVRDTRPAWQVVLGVLVPVANLVLPAVWLTELEHRLDERPRPERPRPSRLLQAWWVTWVAGQLLLVLAVIWRFRGSTQARADSIVISGVSDVVAVGCAVLTLVLLRRLGNELAGTTDRARPPRRWVASVPSRPTATDPEPAPDPVAESGEPESPEPESGSPALETAGARSAS